MYDLHLIPINLQRGQSTYQVLGFRAFAPPRRAARSRSEDLLILSLTTKGKEPIDPDILETWLEPLSQTYFKSSGSVTSALRTFIEALNLKILEKNLKTTRDGGAIRAAINLVSAHRRHLFIVQSGFTHAFTLTHEGLQHFRDASQTDRGLGFSRTPTLRYFQADVGTGGYLFMSDSFPETWREDLLVVDDFPTLEQLRRRLLHQAPTTIRVDLVQLLPGEGKIEYIQPTAKPLDVTEEPLTQALPEIDLPESPTDSTMTMVEDETQKVIKPTETRPETEDIQQEESISDEEGAKNNLLGEADLEMEDTQTEEIAFDQEIMAVGDLSEEDEEELEADLLDEIAFDEEIMAVHDFSEDFEEALESDLLDEITPDEEDVAIPDLSYKSETEKNEVPLEEEDQAAKAEDVQELPLETEAQIQSPLPTSERLMPPKSQAASSAIPINQDEGSNIAQEVNIPAREKLRKQSKKIQEDGLKGLASIFEWWHGLREKTGKFTHRLLARLSSKETHEASKLSSGTLLLIAVAVPLAVVAIALGVYLSRGKTLQYQYYYDQAQTTSQSAAAEQDPTIARQQWESVLTYLDSAEDFRNTEETTALRERAQSALDILDGAVRLRYHPAISGTLYSEILFTRIISYGVDLYLFDAAGGRVIHATRGRQGYTIDPEFVCAAGNYEGGSINAFVDMVSLPINNPYQAHILAVDAFGNVAYCSPGQNPVVQSLPPSGGEAGSNQKIAFENDSLFVLSPTNNTLQIYASTNGQFLEPPVNFFGNANLDQIPDLTQVVDLAINGSELYLLQGDGKLVGCVYTGLPDNPVTCENPVSYVDGRVGKEEQPVTMPAAVYTSLLYTPPPDPAINILDATHADIYRFSLRFRLYQRYRPDLGDYEITSPIATAFTIGVDQVAYIAFGNQVFYAYVE